MPVTSPHPRLRTVAYTSARDLQAITKARNDTIAARAVTNAAANELLVRAEKLLSEAESARSAGRQAAFQVKAVEAQNAALHSYQMVRKTITDLVKAGAVFLARVIPFCFFLMKLISPWTDIRAQIAAFTVIFVAVAASLALLHPAFALSRTPITGRAKPSTT